MLTKLIIDFSHIAHACWSHSTQGMPFWKSIVLGMILKNKIMFNPDEVIIACDGKECWRSQVFKFYKFRRRNKLKSDNSYLEFKIESRKFIEEINEFFPWITLIDDECEADDIIGTLALQNNDDEFIIVSKDKDFFQLHTQKVKQWDPIKDEFVTFQQGCDIYDHTLRGDYADDIPNFLSDDDVFVEKEKSQNILKSAFISILKKKGYEKTKKGDEYSYFIPSELTEWVKKQFKKRKEPLTQYRLDTEVTKLCNNVDRNRRLIDLNFTPRKIKVRIIEQYNEKRISATSKDQDSLEKYFTKFEMVKNLTRIKAFYPREIK